MQKAARLRVTRKVEQLNPFLVALCESWNIPIPALLSVSVAVLGALAGAGRAPLHLLEARSKKIDGERVYPYTRSNQATPASLAQCGHSKFGSVR
jgi:hypothetical protein